MVSLLNKGVLLVLLKTKLQHVVSDSVFLLLRPIYNTFLSQHCRCFSQLPNFRAFERNLTTQNQLWPSLVRISVNWAIKKNGLTFHYTRWFIGILIYIGSLWSFFIAHVKSIAQIYHAHLVLPSALRCEPFLFASFLGCLHTATPGKQIDISLWWFQQNRNQKTQYLCMSPVLWNQQIQHVVMLVEEIWR